VLRSDTAEGPLNQFVADKLEAMASLRPALLEEVKKVPGTKILPGNFTAVQQAIGTAKQNSAGAAFLSSFVAEAKSSGLVARLIERHRVQGLSVAP
jgi:polar amino acid transport system substrate-binding protein